MIKLETLANGVDVDNDIFAPIHILYYTNTSNVLSWLSCSIHITSPTKNDIANIFILVLEITLNNPYISINMICKKHNVYLSIKNGKFIDLYGKFKEIYDSEISPNLSLLI